MSALIYPARLRGCVRAPASKSQAHRLLILAALSDAPSQIHLANLCADLEATLGALQALGAAVERTAYGVAIRPIERPAAHCEIDCGESASTLRFLLPVAGALGTDACFRMRGRLAQRPLAPLAQALMGGGCTLSRPDASSLRICGKLHAGAYALPAGITSQFLTGLLLALPLLPGRSRLSTGGAPVSAGYVEMTLAAQARFGVVPARVPGGFALSGRRYHGGGVLQVEGDWSAAAFFLCANAIDGNQVRVCGLNEATLQRDRCVLGELAALLRGPHTVDATDIPDLIPPLAAAACARGGVLRVLHAGRLRLKESDRLHEIARVLCALGGCVEETDDGLFFPPAHPPCGGEVDAAGDHRIAMMAAIAAGACERPVLLHGAQTVAKSYPAFWNDLRALGGRFTLEPEASHE
ncbi:MAG TPA: 3-phosphoshikimate 1-carboxyvinyltransferase [Candidatus Aphodomonas merdavium]|nr:3-phosphoshikimate 1-carboxyvinyltransferase [Candidatus Aphodomonas merdavium]